MLHVVGQHINCSLHAHTQKNLVKSGRVTTMNAKKKKGLTETCQANAVHVNYQTAQQHTHFSTYQTSALKEFSPYARTAFHHSEALARKRVNSIRSTYRKSNILWHALSYGQTRCYGLYRHAILQAGTSGVMWRWYFITQVCYCERAFTCHAAGILD